MGHAAHPVAAASWGPDRLASWVLSCSLFCWKIASSCSCRDRSTPRVYMVHVNRLGRCRHPVHAGWRRQANENACGSPDSPGSTVASWWSTAGQRRTARRGSCRRQRRAPSGTSAWRPWPSPSGRPDVCARVHDASESLPSSRCRHGRRGVQMPQMPGRQGGAAGLAGWR